jgi:hypothetical protein
MDAQYVAKSRVSRSEIEKDTSVRHQNDESGK